jgi:hypothetical protein
MARRPSTEQNRRKDHPVVDFGQARAAHKLKEYQHRVRSVAEANKRSIVRLFESGLIFTRQGARLGRDLLLAHQHLLKVLDLLVRITEVAGDGSRLAAPLTEALYAQMQELLIRTTELAARSDLLLARRT